MKECAMEQMLAAIPNAYSSPKTLVDDLKLLSPPYLCQFHEYRKNIYGNEGAGCKISIEKEDL